MQTLPISTARANLYGLVDETISSSTPVQIRSKRGNAVLLAEDDWIAIQETLYLQGISGMKDSIRAGMQTPVAECSTSVQW